MARDPAVDTVALIVKDLTNRRGLRHEWWAIDADIRREIIQTWRRIIRESYAKKVE